MTAASVRGRGRHYIEPALGRRSGNVRLPIKGTGLKKASVAMFLRSSRGQDVFSRNESEESILDCSPKLTMGFASSCRSRQGHGEVREGGGGRGAAVGGSDGGAGRGRGRGLGIHPELITTWTPTNRLSPYRMAAGTAKH